MNYRLPATWKTSPVANFVDSPDAAEHTRCTTHRRHPCLRRPSQAKETRRLNVEAPRQIINVPLHVRASGDALGGPWILLVDPAPIPVAAFVQLIVRTSRICDCHQAYLQLGICRLWTGIASDPGSLASSISRRRSCLR